MAKRRRLDYERATWLDRAKHDNRVPETVPKKRKRGTVGLHNPNDPRYHAKRGNLFRTYLSQHDPEPAPSVRPRSKRSKQERIDRLLSKDRTRKPQSTSPAPDLPAGRIRGSVVKLAAFVDRHMESHQRASFLDAIKTRHPPLFPISRADDTESLLGLLLTDRFAERYLLELERRHAAGEPLVRHIGAHT